MKKIIRTLCLVAMVALVATSCKKKEEEANFNFTVGETYGFEVGPSLDGSKAYFDPADGYRFKWNAGDPVVIYNLASDYTQSECGLFTADQAGQGSTFSSTEVIGGPKDLGYFAFYNGQNAHRNIEADNRETFDVPATQTYDANCYADPTAMVMACRVPAVNNHIGTFTMQHIFGYLNIGIADNLNQSTPKKVTSIVVTDAAFNLTGEVSLKLGEVDAETLNGLINQCESTNGGQAYVAALESYLTTLGYNSQGAEKSITMNCNFQLPWRQWQYFFISLRPGALYKGFTVTINYDDSTSATKTFGADINYLIKPGYFRNVYFTTANGWIQ